MSYQKKKEKRKKKKDCYMIRYKSQYAVFFFLAGVAVVNLLTDFLLSCYLQNLQTSQKQSAAQHCNCTIADVENALAKFTWAREAHKKIEKLKEEGKPMPTSLAEVLHALVCFDSQIRFTHNTRKLLCAYIHGRHCTLL